MSTSPCNVGRNVGNESATASNKLTPKINAGSVLGFFITVWGAAS